MHTLSAYCTARCTSTNRDERGYGLECGDEYLVGRRWPKRRVLDFLQSYLPDSPVSDRVDPWIVSATAELRAPVVNELR